VGTCTINANQAGNADYEAASQVSQSFTIAKATPSLSSFANVSKTVGNSAFDLSAPSVANSLPGSFTYTSATTATATISGATVTLGSAGTTVITATFTPTDTTNYNNATITMTLTVTAAVYSVGDRGPGGGIVFYVSASNFTSTGSTCNTTCRYLEAAPTSGTSPWTDAIFKWSGNTNTSIGASAKGTAIGTGYQNTLAIVGQDATANKAGTVTRDYRGPNNLSDWFLPSKDELNQMCKWQRGITGEPLTNLATRCAWGTLNSGLGASGFKDSGYWSSSEHSTTVGDAWYQYWQNGTQGNQSHINKGNEFYVRPIRAFGAP
jgi:hypothetical protein